MAFNLVTVDTIPFRWPVGWEPNAQQLQMLRTVWEVIMAPRVRVAGPGSALVARVMQVVSGCGTGKSDALVTLAEHFGYRMPGSTFTMASYALSQNHQFAAKGLQRHSDIETHVVEGRGGTCVNTVLLQVLVIWMPNC